MKAKLIKTNGSESDIDLPDDDALRYRAISDFVLGSVEQITLRNGRIMYLNDDGKMLGLDVNAIATRLAHGLTPLNEHVLGNVVVVDPKVK